MTERILSILLAEESVSYKIGYWFGAFIGAAWPYLLVVLFGYIIFRLIRYKQGTNSGR